MAFPFKRHLELITEMTSIEPIRVQTGTRLILESILRVGTCVAG